MATFLSVVLPFVFIVLSNAFVVVIPGMGDFNIPLTAGQRNCGGYLHNFASQYKNPSNDCGRELYTKQWNNYKRGFFDAAFDFGYSYQECSRLAGADMTYKAYCDYINTVVTECECDITHCITEEIIDLIDDEDTEVCYPVANSLCKKVQKHLNPQCEKALNRRFSADHDLQYDTRLVTRTCQPDRCPSSALKLTTTVALLTLMGSLFL